MLLLTYSAPSFATPTVLPMCLQAGGSSYVLRKKPPGKVLPSAHAVEREFKVLAALQATPVPVPRVVSSKYAAL
jgi:aminoglycoside phosphotransferase (APT) family kinase protein